MLSYEDRLHMWPEICGSTHTLIGTTIGLPCGNKRLVPCHVVHALWEYGGDTTMPLANLSWVGGGTSKFLHSAYNSQLRPARATAAQSGGAWAAPRRTGAGNSDTQSRVASPYLEFVRWCRGAASITGFYKLGRRCNAMVWLALTLCEF